MRTDNGSNMVKAFANNIYSPDCDSEAEDDIADPAVIEDMTDLVPDVIHLQCYGHTLQLVVGDGLKETKAIYGVTGKYCKIPALLHSSSNFQVCCSKDLVVVLCLSRQGMLQML